jgi:hypothetical protein
MIISGKVKSNGNDLLIGAIVYESSEAGAPINNVATTTSVDGNYTLNTKAANSYLTAKLIGYSAKTIKAENPSINFVLQPTTQTLGTVEIFADAPKPPEPPKPQPPPPKISWWDKNSLYVYLGAGALATIIIAAIITSQISKPVKGA